MNDGLDRRLHGLLPPGARAALVSITVVLAGCAATPAERTALPSAAPAAPSLQEWMQRAQAAAQAGQREQARQAWRGAARTYPADKAPWQRLAEDYFAAGDHGNAILAAQEVLQRDGRDTIGHGVLALGGLRLAAGSLAALRDTREWRVGHRDEAATLTRAMHESLGEPALAAPPPLPAGRPTHPAVRAAAMPPRAAPRPAVASSAAPAPVVPVAAPHRSGGAPPAVTAPGRSAVPAARAPGNPFTLLN